MRRSNAGQTDTVCASQDAVIPVFPDGTIAAPRSDPMDDWWGDIDNEILAALSTGEAMDPADIARRLGVSEASVTSLIWALVSQGKIRVRLVEAAA
jgi:hypothetical protein